MRDALPERLAGKKAQGLPGLINHCGISIPKAEVESESHNLDFEYRLRKLNAELEIILGDSTGLRDDLA